MSWQYHRLARNVLTEPVVLPRNTLDEPDSSIYCPERVLHLAEVMSALSSVKSLLDGMSDSIAKILTSNSPEVTVVCIYVVSGEFE